MLTPDRLHNSTFWRKKQAANATVQVIPVKIRFGLKSSFSYLGPDIAKQAQIEIKVVQSC